MLARVRVVTAVLLVLAQTGLAACGGGDGGEDDLGALAREAGAVVEKLERALARRDYERVCNELLSADVRRQAGGGECPDSLARTSGGLKRPRIEIERIQIRGAAAVVDVVTSAENQPRVADTIRLVREAGAYRISSLSG